MRRLIFGILMTASPLMAFAQPGPGGSTPMVVDLRKAVVGSWADYSMTLGGMQMKSHWALVARDAKSSTMEMAMEGGPMAMMGGKMVVRMVLAPDPTATDKPIKKLIMQMGNREPMDMPLDIPNMPAAQKFQKPDPKKLVGKEEIKVGAGTFKAQHYREQTAQGFVDAWVSEDVPPLGIIKAVNTPNPGAKGPNGTPIPAMTMELVARGKDAKPLITKPAKPFDPAAFGGPPGGAPPSRPRTK